LLHVTAETQNLTEKQQQKQVTSFFWQSHINYTSNNATTEKEKK